MAIGDHFVITLRGRNIVSGGSDSDNVFVYEQISGSGTAQDLLSAWGDDVYGEIVNILAEAWNFGGCECINLDDPTDFGSLSTSVNGQRTGDPMPPFVAASFIYRRTSRAFNNGGKRFGPISEADVTAGIPTTTYNGLLQACADALEWIVEDTPTLSQWRPVIWRRPGTYASGVVAAPGLFNIISDVDFTAISSQNTRKAGRGS